MEILNSYTPVFLYNLLLSPKKTLIYIIQQTKEDEHIGIALATAASAFIFELIGKSIALKKRLMITFFIELNIIPYIIGFFGNLLLISAVWFFINNFIINKKKRIEFSSRNIAYILFKSICLTYYPFIFSPVLAVLSISLSSLSSAVIYFLLKLALIFWVIYLQILVLKITFDIKTITAFLLYILPIVVLIAFFVINMWIFLSSFVLTLI